MKSNTLSSLLCPTKTMSLERRKRVALQVITNQKTITQLVDESNTSRKFIRQQGENVQNAIDNIYDLNTPDSDDVLYSIQVTET